MGDYLINRTTDLQTQINTLVEDRRRLTLGLIPSSVCGGEVVSLESLSQEIKLKSGVIVDLRTDLIDREYNDIVSIIEKDKLLDVDNSSVVANAILSVIKTKFNYIDKPNSWTQTPEQIEQMRAPVSKAYESIFGSKDNEFNHRIDFSDFELALNQSPMVRKIPAIFTLDKSFSKMELLDKLLKGLDESILKMDSVIGNILTECLNVLKRGQEISKADTINLDVKSLVTMGFKLEPFVNQTVGDMWYGNNALTTKLASMDSDLRLLLEEPLSFVEMPLLDDKAFKIKNICTVLINPDFDSIYDGIKRKSIKLNDHIKLTSDKLFRISDELNKIPQKTSDGYYNFAIEDIARLISIFSGVLVLVQDFAKRVLVGFSSGYTNIVVLSNHLTNYRKLVEQYIQQRKES